MVSDRRFSERLRGLGWSLWPWLALLALIALFFPISIHMPGDSYSGPLPPLSSQELELRERLQSHVEALARRIGERNLYRHGALQAAADYIQSTLEGFGYEVEVQEYRMGDKAVRTLIASLAGMPKGDEVVLAGAHYDSVRGSPGVNDNASGVATLLEIARLLSRGDLPNRTIRFVAFPIEEPPWFQTGSMASGIYAREARRRGDRIVGMLSLETLGYYDDQTSQRYPFPMGLFYPWTGNFVGFVANPQSKELLFQSLSAFRRHMRFPSEGLAAPSWVMGVDWSDHASFWDEGYPAIMVTDTALFRYDPYHSGEDTPDKLTYDRFARVVMGLSWVIADLAR